MVKDGSMRLRHRQNQFYAQVCAPTLRTISTTCRLGACPHRERAVRAKASCHNRARGLHQSKNVDFWVPNDVLQPMKWETRLDCHQEQQ